MTQPMQPTITTLEPYKSKTWIAAIGGALTVVVPLVLSFSTSLPEPWPALIAAVVAVLTAVGVYRAPYKPEGTTVVPTHELTQVATPLPPTAPASDISLRPKPTPGLGGDVQGPWD
jgi:hypothetical protein